MRRRLEEGGLTIFVDNLSKRVSRLALKELFSNYGKVERVYIPVNNTKPKYKFFTFAFVSMANAEDLDHAISSVDKSRIDGLVVRVSKAKFPRYRLGVGFSEHARDGVEKLIKSDNPPVTGGVNSRLTMVGFSVGGVSSGKTYRDALLSFPSNPGMVEVHHALQGLWVIAMNPVILH